MAKRRMFDELLDGVAEMKRSRIGKLTLRQYKIETKPLPKVGSETIKKTSAK